MSSAAVSWLEPLTARRWRHPRCGRSRDHDRPLERGEQALPAQQLVVAPRAHGEQPAADEAGER